MPKVIGMDNKVFKTITCRSCAAVNEYAPNEVRLLWEGKDYSGGPDGGKGFNCAGCNLEIVTERW